MGLFDQDRDFVGYGRRPPKVIWPEEARVAVNVVVAYEEGSELSHSAGDGRREMLGEFPLSPDTTQPDILVESVFQYGSRAGVWRLARILDEHDVRGTFLACAAAVELNRDLGAYIAEAGHDVCCHGWRYEDLNVLSDDEERERLHRAVASLEDTTGQRPVGWFGRGSTKRTRKLLVEEGGFLYDSDAMDDDLPYFVDVDGQRLLIVPYGFVHNDGQLLGPLGNSTPAQLLDTWCRGLDELWREGATHPRMMTVAMHSRWMGQPARAGVLREFMEYAQQKGGVWLARRRDIAEWWLAHHEEFEA
jgi:peptidoglycan/xylan/chitin deacetylase (PgdA/CDA1 family)